MRRPTVGETSFAVRSNQPARMHAMLWQDSKLASLPYAMNFNDELVKKAETEPELRHCLFDGTRCIGLAGDWIVEGSVEGAWLSGYSLGVSTLKHALSTPGREQDLINRIREHQSEREFMTKEIKWQKEWTEKFTKRNRMEELIVKVKARWTNKVLVKAFSRLQEHIAHVYFLKRLFKDIWASREETLLKRLFHQWEEAVQIGHLSKVMSSVLKMLKHDFFKLCWDTWVQAATSGTGWQMMKAVHKQREILSKTKILKAWQGFAAADKGTLFLPLFISRRKTKLLANSMREWRELMPSYIKKHELATKGALADFHDMASPVSSPRSREHAADH